MILTLFMSTFYNFSWGIVFVTISCLFFDISCMNYIKLKMEKNPFKKKANETFVFCQVWFLENDFCIRQELNIRFIDIDIYKNLVTGS